MTKTDQDRVVSIEDYAKMILEQSELSNNSVKSIVNAINRLNNINLNNIFTYKSIEEINDKICARLNAKKNQLIHSDHIFPIQQNHCVILWVIL